MHKFSNYELITALKLRPEKQFIINCLRSEFDADTHDELPEAQLSAVDWNMIYEKSIQWGIASLLYKIIKKRSSPAQFASISDHFIQKMKIEYMRTFFSNKLNFQELANLLEVFSKAGIKLILLKGSHLAQFVYQDIGLRPMSDIDILVEKKDVDQAEGLLFQNAYDYKELNQATYDWYKEHFNVEGRANIIKWCKANMHQLLPFSNPRGIKKLEIHKTIDRVNSPFSIDMVELWKRSRAVQIKRLHTSVLSPEDLLLHLSLHVSHQHKLSAFRLRPFCDIAAVISHYEQEIDWNKVQIRAHEWGAEKYIYISLLLSQEILGARVPDRMLHALKPNPFNKKITLEASKRVLSFEPPPFQGMRDRARILVFHSDDSLIRRVSYFLKKVFISEEDLATRYSVTASSKRVYFYYVVRFISLLYSYIPLYSSYYLYRLVHKKNYHCNYNLDLWLSSEDDNQWNKKL